MALISGLSDLAPSVPEREAYRSLETVDADYSWVLLCFFFCVMVSTQVGGVRTRGSRDLFHLVPSYR